MSATSASQPSATQLIESIQRQLTDLETYQVDQLRQCTAKSMQNDLSAEMRRDMDGVRHKLSELEIAVDDEEDPRVREMLSNSHQRLQMGLSKVRSAYRDALLESSNKIKNQNRMELLPQVDDASRPAISGKHSSIDGTIGSRRDDGDELQTKTNEVTDALRRTTQLMQIELEKSVMATQMLDESSATLRSTTTLYDRYSSLLTTSSRLVHQIEQADWYDRLIIFSALAFFLLVVAFIVKRRVLDKAVHGVGWWVGGSWRLVTGQWRQSPKEVVKGVVGIKSGKDLLPVVTEAAATAVRTLASEQKGDQMETLESALRQHHEL